MSRAPATSQVAFDDSYGGECQRQSESNLSFVFVRIVFVYLFFLKPNPSLLTSLIHNFFDTC